MGQSVQDFDPRPDEHNRTLERLEREAEEARRREEEAERLRSEAEERERQAKMREEEAQRIIAEARRMEEEANRQREEAKRGEEEARRHAEEAARRGREAEEREQETRKRAEESQRIADEAKRMEEEANQQRERAIKGEEDAKRQMQEASRRAHEARANEEAAKAREDKARKQEEEARKMQREAIELLGQARKGEEEAKKLMEEAERRAHEARSKEDAARAIQEEAQAREEEARVLLDAAIQDLSSGVERAMQPTLEQIEAAKARIQYNPENLHFAITGTAGSGKSSLINALRHMKNNNPNAARTGITETTLEIGRYPDPDKNLPRSRFIWYDVPGAGTLNIPGWQHFNDQALYVFDIILVVMDNRFTKIDVEILRNCRRFNIPSFIIRSKADQHITNLMDDLPDDEDEDEDDDDDAQPSKPRSPVDKRARARQTFIDRTRKSVAENLAAAELPPQDVYIVSNKIMYHLMSERTVSDICRLISGRTDLTDMIDEKKFLRDALTAAYNRRYHTVDR